MSDPQDDLLRANARKLATNLLRDPFLAVAYRDAVVGAVGDSDPTSLVTRWIVKAGYGTRDDLLSEALLDAAHTNLAAWDGVYLVLAEAEALVVLEINEYGVRVDGCRASDVSFIDGVLAFGPSKASPWAGELRFKRVAPPAGQPISVGGVYQSLCVGKLWRKGAAKPAADNARGSTKREVLAASKHAVPANAPLRAGAANTATAAAGPPTFIGKWSGKYDVTLTDQPHSPAYGVSGSTDKAARLTYLTPYDLDVTASGQSVDHIKYSDKVYEFDLTFGEFSNNVRCFVGFIYPVDTKVPARANAQGLSQGLPPADTTSNPVLIALTAAGVLVGAITAILTLVAAKYGAYLVAKHEAAEAQNTGNADVIEAAKKKLSDSEIEMTNLSSSTTSNNPAVGVLGDQEAKQDFTNAAIEQSQQIEQDEKAHADQIGVSLEDLSEQVRVSEKELADALELLRAMKEGEIEGNLQEAEARAREAESTHDSLDLQAEKAKEVKDSHDERSELNGRKKDRAMEVKEGFPI